MRLGGTVPEYISKCACKPHDKFMSLSICFHDANVSEQMFIACASCVDVVGIDKVATALAPKFIQAALPHLIPTRSPASRLGCFCRARQDRPWTIYIYIHIYLIYNS